MAYHRHVARETLPRYVTKARKRHNQIERLPRYLRDLTPAEPEPEPVEAEAPKPTRRRKRKVTDVDFGPIDPVETADVPPMLEDEDDA